MNKELFSSVLFFLVSVYVCWQSLKLGFGRFAQPGPGFISFLSGLVLGFLAIVLFLKTRIAKNLHEKISKGGIPWKALLLAFGSMVGFTAFMETLGFNLSAFLLIGILLRVVEKKSWIVSGLVALSVTLGAFILFQLLLKSQLPEGPFGFFGF